MYSKIYSKVIQSTEYIVRVIDEEVFNMKLVSVFIGVVYFVGVSLAKCKITISYDVENAEEEILNGYKDARNSKMQRFINIMKRRIADPICTANEDMLKALCECLEENVPEEEPQQQQGEGENPKGKNKKKENNNATCSWKIISRASGANTLKYANVHQCKSKKLFITQGYAVHDNNIYDVYVVGPLEGTENKFVIKGVANTVDFDKLEATDNNYLYKVFLHGLSFLFNWHKHY